MSFKHKRLVLPFTRCEHKLVAGCQLAREPPHLLRIMNQMRLAGKQSAVGDVAAFNLTKPWINGALQIKPQCTVPVRGFQSRCKFFISGGAEDARTQSEKPKNDAPAAGESFRASDGSLEDQ